MDDDAGAMSKSLKGHTRACEACRKLKTQCIFTSMRAPACDRCTKGNRRCVLPFRKARPKVLPTVLEIEKKIRVLMSELADIQALRPQCGLESHEQEDSAFSFSNLPAPENVHNIHSGVPIAQRSGNSIDDNVPQNTAAVADGFPHPPQTNPSTTWPGSASHSDLTSEMATMAFNYFVANMLPQFPVLVIPSGVTAATMQQRQPTLFLAVLNAASGLFPAAVQMSINRELLATFARLILVVGSKSLELVQALQVGTIWYYAPPQYKDLKYYQYIHCASVMAIDLGLNRNKPSWLEPKVGLAELRSAHNNEHQPVLTSSLEARRAWLVCYFTSSQTAQNLRRENLIRWTPYLAECLQILSSSLGAADSDKVLCRWVRLQHIADDIGNQFLVEQPSSSRTLDDTSLQFTVKSFERQLDEFASSSGEQGPILLRMTESFIRVYLHEVALHAGSLDDEMQPPFTEEALGKMTPMRELSLSTTYVRSLSDCLNNIYAFLDAFLAISIEDLQCQPIFVFVRLTYVLVVLVRINTSAFSQHQNLGEEFLRAASEKVYEYAGAAIERLRQASQGNRCASASKFCLVIMSLRMCFERISSERGRTTQSLCTTETRFASSSNSHLQSATSDSIHPGLGTDNCGHAFLPQPSEEASQRSFTTPVSPDLELTSRRNYDSGETLIWPWLSIGMEGDVQDSGSEIIGPAEALFDDEMLRMLTQADAPMFTSARWS